MHHIMLIDVWSPALVAFTKNSFEAATESVGSKDDIHCRHLLYNWYE